jgi:TolB-like protein
MHRSSTCKLQYLSLLGFLLPGLLSALPKVAVLDITAPKEMDQSIIVPITEMIMEEVVASNAYIVLDRSHIEQVFKEKEFQLSGIVSDSQVAEVGQYLGADYVVAGKAQAVAGAYFLVAKMIDVKTGVIKVQASEQAEGKILILLDLARSVGRKLAGGGAGPAASGAAFGESIAVSFRDSVDDLGPGTEGHFAAAQGRFRAQRFRG